MNDLSIFDFETNPVRVVTVGDAPWWVATDISTILGYRNAPDMVRMLDDDQRGTHLVRTLGGDQTLSIVTEGGMFTCVIRSKRPEAKRFLRWITDEVLPSIFRTGRYALPGYDPPPPQALDFEPARLMAGVAVVREARRLYGPVAARTLWVQVGLPPVTADAEAVLVTDPFAVPLLAYLADRAETTIQQAAEGMGIDAPDHSTRYRIGRLLAAWGWTPRNRKIARHRTARVFSRPPSMQTVEQEARP